jgi:hypothetical protein
MGMQPPPPSAQPQPAPQPPPAAAACPPAMMAYPYPVAMMQAAAMGPPPGYGYASPAGSPPSMCGPCAPRWVPISGEVTRTSQDPIKPGEVIEVIITPRAWFKGERLKLKASQASNLKIASVKVGMGDVLIDTGEIDGESFASDQDGAGRLPMPWCAPRDEIKVRVRNVSEEPLLSIYVEIHGTTATP